NTSPANFPASNIIAHTVKKRPTSMPPAAPRTRGRPAARAHVGRLKRLRRLGMELHGVVDYREGDGLAVLRLDQDLRRPGPSGDPPTRDFLGGRVVADLAEPLPLPQRLAFPLIEDLDVDSDLHLALRDVGDARARLIRDRHVGVVADDLPPYHGVRVALPREPE